MDSINLERLFRIAVNSLLLTGRAEGLNNADTT
jgi:hypothetical protein